MQHRHQQHRVLMGLHPVGFCGGQHHQAARDQSARPRWRRDIRLARQALDRDLADFARGHGIPLLPVLTKADKCTQVERSKRQQEWSRLLNGIMPLPVSSKDMRGVDALWSELRRFAGTGESVSEEE